MKRVLTSLLVVLTGFFMFAMFATETVKAEGDLIDLYPNEDINNLKGTFGNSGWVLDFGGYRYHTVSFMARYGSKFVGIDDLEKKEFKGADIGHISANAMGGFISNNTERDVILKDGDRTALTGVINRVWAVFDETGNLVLFEDHIYTYFIKEVAGENYFRLATPEEIAIYEAAPEGEKPADMRNTHMRMALNADGETYKIEPLGNLKWTNADYVAAEGDVPQQGVKSVIFDYDPNEVHLKAGYTALHFSTWDRGKAKFNALIKAMPGFLASQEHKMELNYLNPAPTFVNLTTKDENPAEEGINLVFNYESVPAVSKLVSAVEARHVNQEEWFLGTHTKVNYAVKIFDEEKTLLETVEVIYNETEEKYIPSKEVFEFIDTTNWGVRYFVEYSTTQPEYDNETSYVTGPTTFVEATIDVGVLPIHFTGVAPRVMNEGLPVELLLGIKAYDNSKDMNEITSSLTYTITNQKTGSNHFNIWNAKAGIYDVEVRANFYYSQEVDFTNDVEISLGDKTGTINANRINIAGDPFGWASTPPPMALYTEFNETTRTKLKSSDLKYNVQMALINGAGEIVAYFNTITGKMRVEGGTEVAITGSNREPSRAAWINAIKFGVGYRLIAGYAPTDDVHILLQTAKLGDKIKGLGFTAEVVGIRNYRLEVKDITLPMVTVRQETMTIYTDNSFKNAEEAILSNLNIYEENEYVVAITGLARIDITEPGEHNIKMVIADVSGNEVEVEFKLIVAPKRASEADLDALQAIVDGLKTTINALEVEIANLEAAIAATNGDVEELETALTAAKASITALQTALNDAKTKITTLENKVSEQEDAIDGLLNPETPPKTGCKSAITGGITILALSFVLGTALVVFLKKRR